MSEMTWDVESMGYLLTLDNSSTAVHTFYYHVLGVLIKRTSYVFRKMPLIHVIILFIMKAIHSLIIFINLFVY